MRKAATRIVAAFLPLAISANALAQPADPATRTSGRPQSTAAEGWSVTVGVAPMAGPAWEGSDDMILSIFPDVRIAYGDTIFASIPDGVGWNAINDNGWKAGPIAKLRFGRDEDGGGSPFAVAGSSDALAGMGDVDPAEEVGGFVEKRFGAARQWSGRIETVRGSGGHEGIVADLSLA
ncbi:outer membrane scaffolding protein for murein synthesis (MipA/OmpV family) [Croceicoccus sp. BE223]|nr:outer membrane scaffolding protein for murein synthesis (MipA/OmpV family) [Croceicoccus sp. BE223]